MTALKAISLGAAGLSFIKTGLYDGGKGVCLKLLDLPLSEGTVFTPLPTDVGLDRALTFKVGGIIKNANIEGWFAEHIVSLSSKNPNGSLIFQDVWGGRPGEAGTKHRKSSMFFNQTNLYHFVEPKNMNPQSIIYAMREITSFLKIGAFVNVPIAASKLPKDLFVDDNFIEHLANNTREIYISAYDQEGLVIWQR
jgi:hypothetical protein